MKALKKIKLRRKPKAKKAKPKPSTSTKPEPIIKVIKQIIHVPAKDSLTPKQKRTVGLFTIWSVVFWTFFLANRGQMGVEETLFYFGLLVTAVVNIILVSTGRIQKEVKEDTQINVARAFPAFALWGGLIFGLNLFLFLGAGRNLQAPSTFEILRQMIVVVPSETYIFIVFLPTVLDWGITRKIGWFPGWLYAQGLFGIMHIISGAMTPILGIFASFMGILWYLLYRAGKHPVYGQYFGIAAVFAFHFIWNVMNLSAKGSIDADPLIIFFKIVAGL